MLAGLDADVLEGLWTAELRIEQPGPTVGSAKGGAEEDPAPFQQMTFTWPKSKPNSQGGIDERRNIRVICGHWQRKQQRQRVARICETYLTGMGAKDIMLRPIDANHR